QHRPPDQVQRTIGEVKAAHPVLETPVTVDREDTVHTVLTLIEKRSHGAAVVIDGGRPVGVVTRSDCQGVDQFTQAGQVMTPDPTVLTLDVLTGSGALERAYEAQEAARRRFAPVVDEAGQLVGGLAQSGGLRCARYAPAVGEGGRMRWAA